MKSFLSHFSWKVSAVLLMMAVALLLEPIEALAQRRSFGGSRSGSSRSFRSSPSSRSFGGSRSTRSRPAARNYQNQRSSTTRNSPGSSFGGTRATSQSYRSTYGAPRKSETMNLRGTNGMPQNVVVHSYGGRSDGFMMGYLMGHTSWMWSMPFHPAFYYSRPQYVTNANGVAEVYPPTFSFFRLFVGLIMIGGAIYIVIRIVRYRKAMSSGNYSSSSFG